MYKRIKKIGRRFIERMKLWVESLRDAEKYFEAASWAGPCDHHKIAHIEADIIRHYHVLEKVLCMPDFQPRRGQDILICLIALIKQWETENGDLASTHFIAANHVVASYYRRHKELGIYLDDLIPRQFKVIEASDCLIGGRKVPMVIPEVELATFEKIALSRHSIRDFDSRRIPSRDKVMDALRIALSTPSVCNRQTWRVHFFETQEAQRILALQNGNRGFGHLIPLVAVVTSDMRRFSGCNERYQSWIEAGMFSMSFILALHSKGIGTIALNWSRSNNDDKLLRCAAGIPKHERVSMLIGCGYAETGHSVACSPRSALDDFAVWHDQT